jgi:hypothetical protein
MLTPSPRGTRLVSVTESAAPADFSGEPRSERKAIEQKIEQCRRFMTPALDPVTTERLKAFLAELELELAKLQ